MSTFKYYLQNLRDVKILSNKIALVVGGANGVGAAITNELLKRNYEKVYIADRSEPGVQKKKTEFIKINLVSDDVEDLARLSDVNTLVITAGIGRLDYFGTNSTTEIENSFKVNTLSVIKLIKAFYNKIHSENDFLCAVMSSIAGHVSSPLYAVYSATKAAVSRFVESINAELCGEGFANRILEVSPGNITGTRFHGGENDFDAIAPLACEIIEKMQNKDTLFIPNAKVYENVIARYQANPAQFGAESYEYKLEKNSLETKPRTKIGYLTGSFDLFHIGHLNLLRRAKQYCDYLIVGVHTDGSHKGKELFIPLEERIEIVANCKYVDMAMECSQSDLDAYDDIKYDYLFVGSDYKGTERFKHYEEVLLPLGVEIIYFPYTQGTSSSQLRDKLNKK